MITAQEAQSLLEAKFPGVRKDGLTQIAGTLALMCETKEDAEKLINNMTDEAVNAQVKTMRSAIDAEVSCDLLSLDYLCGSTNNTMLVTFLNIGCCRRVAVQKKNTNRNAEDTNKQHFRHSYFFG